MNMISDTIKYIGVDDLDIDLFESQYVVPEGMSYNSYLIDDEKIAVMDTADRRKGEAWKANLKAALNGRQLTTWSPTMLRSSLRCSRLTLICSSFAVPRL